MAGMAQQENNMAAQKTYVQAELVGRIYTMQIVKRYSSGSVLAKKYDGHLIVVKPNEIVKEFEVNT